MLEIMMPEEYPGRRNLLDSEHRAKLPQLYGTEEQRLDAQAIVKFFSPESGWTWYAAEFDGDDLLYGLVIGNEIELGYFSLYDLETTKGALGLPIEQDVSYEPKSLGELIELYKQERTEKAGEENELLGRIVSFASQLSKWDKRIVEIIGIGSVNRDVLEPSDLVELVCIFNPQPKDNIEGSFSIANLMIRDEFENASDRLGIVNPMDLAFKLNEKIYLPNGKILDMPEDQMVLWKQNE